MKIGDRVIHLIDGGVGFVESFDDLSADVRWLTPDNKPSCCVGVCWAKDLRVVSEKVLPMPRSEKWKAEARAFHTFIQDIIDEAENEWENK